MRKFSQVITAVCIAILLAVQTAFLAAAESLYSSVTEECFGYFTEQRGSVEFWDGLEYGGADWAAYCRARLYGAVGAESYAASAESRVAELAASGRFVPPTDYHRAAVCIAAAGGNAAQAVSLGVFCNEQLDRQGFNAYIWGLIALNVTGEQPPENAVNTAQSLAEHIISKQHEDGSFSLMGDSGDVDITAAAVYALAGSDVPGAGQAAERGADWLGGIEGGYSSMGVVNCESTAQAVIAFSAAGMPEAAQEAARQLEEFRCEGGYSHLSGGSFNAVATVQALEAFTALALSERGEMLFGRIIPADISAASAETAVTEEVTAVTEEAAEAAAGFTGAHIKLIISAAAGLAAAICAVLFPIRRKRALIPAAVLFAAVAGGVWLLDIRTPEEYYSGSMAGSLSVTISADCSAVLDDMDSIDPAIVPPEVVPADGRVIARCEVLLPEGASAFDALTAAARQQRVRVDYSGGMYGTYVSGIGNIAEFGFGSLSGWMYRVNGEYPEVSASAYSLKEGDMVEFVYTCDMGRDIGVPDQGKLS